MSSSIGMGWPRARSPTGGARGNRGLVVPYASSRGRTNLPSEGQSGLTQGGRRQSSARRRLLLVVALAAGVLGAVPAIFPGAASASTSTVPLSAQLVVLNHTGVTNPGGQPDCSTAQFLEVSVGPGIASVQGFVDTITFGQTVTVSLTGPPFPDDHFDAASHGLGNLGEAPWSFDAPAGTHWWALDWFNSIGACQSPASVGYDYFNPLAQGVQQGNQLSGTVTDSSGQGVGGVTVTAASTDGGGTFSTSTAGDGSYSETVPADTYTVTPSLNQDAFQPSASTVDLTAGNGTANFTLLSAALSQLPMWP